MMRTLMVLGVLAGLSVAADDLPSISSSGPIGPPVQAAEQEPLTGSADRTFGVYCWESTAVTGGLTNSAWNTLKSCVDDPGMKLGGWLLIEGSYLFCTDFPDCMSAGTDNYTEITNFILALDGKGDQATTRPMPVGFMYGWTLASGGDVQTIYANAANFIDRVTDYLSSAEAQVMASGADELSYKRFMIQYDIEPGDCFCSAPDYINMLAAIRAKVDAWNSSSPTFSIDLNIYCNNVVGLVASTPPAGCDTHTCAPADPGDELMVSAIMDYADSVTIASGRNLACFQQAGAALDPATCAYCQQTFDPATMDGIAPWIHFYTGLAAAKKSETGHDVKVSFHVSTRARDASGHCTKVTFGNCAQASALITDPFSLWSQLDSARDALSAWGSDPNMLQDDTGIVPGFDGVFIHDLGGYYTLYNYSASVSGTYMTPPGWTKVPSDPCVTFAECINTPCSTYPPGGTATVCPVASECPTEGPGCTGDYNDDEQVDGADLGIFLAYWGTAQWVCDLNSDGIVDGQDLTILLGRWGPC